MTPSAVGRLLIAVFMAAVMTACGGGDGNELSGTVTGLAEETDAQPGSWLITIELDDGAIAASTDVQIAFDAPDLVCDDGSGIVVPTSVSIGDRLTVQRQPGTEIETMDPPIVAGERVVVLCSS